MRIPCPYCGLRDLQEYGCLGDAVTNRPTFGGADELGAYHDYVYLRDNPVGEKRELWYHANGCRRWLVVTRNTLTHAISGAEFLAGTGERS